MTVNVPLAGGMLGAPSTLSISTNVDVIVVVVMDVAVAVVVVSVVVDAVVIVDTVDVTLVVVVLVGMAMVNVVVANRAAVDESPTGNAYRYTRGDVTPQMPENPCVDKITMAVPLRLGNTRSNRGPICTVAPLETLSARRNARS